MSSLIGSLIEPLPGRSEWISRMSRMIRMSGPSVMAQTDTWILICPRDCLTIKQEISTWAIWQLFLYHWVRWSVRCSTVCVKQYETSSVDGSTTSQLVLVLQWFCLSSILTFISLFVQLNHSTVKTPASTTSDIVSVRMIGWLSDQLDELTLNGSMNEKQINIQEDSLLKKLNIALVINWIFIIFHI